MGRAFRLAAVVEEVDGVAPRCRGKVHVPERRPEIRVARKLLDGLGRRALHGEVRAEGVPEHVRADEPKPRPLAIEAERRFDC